MTKRADPDPNPLGMDPRIRIRIHTKMSWIRNTASYCVRSFTKLKIPVRTSLRFLDVSPDLAEAVAEGAGHLGGGVGCAVGHILEQSAQVPLAHQPRESLRHVVEEAQRVAQEVRRAQDEHSLREREDAILKGTVS
jgi:hypothetical protein